MKPIRSRPTNLALVGTGVLLIVLAVAGLIEGLIRDGLRGVTDLNTIIWTVVFGGLGTWCGLGGWANLRKPSDRVQLVLQFKPWDAKQFEQLVSLEDQLRVALGPLAAVDGHDLGSGEANIFIYCPEPDDVLARCLPVVKDAGLLQRLSAAHRPVKGERYTRVWPIGVSGPFRVT